MTAGKQRIIEPRTQRRVLLSLLAAIIAIAALSQLGSINIQIVINLTSFYKLPAFLQRTPTISTESDNIVKIKFSNFAIALKTGQETLASRTPIQLLTFLARVPNVLVIGEAPGHFIDGREMVDVYTKAYNESVALVGLGPFEVVKVGADDVELTGGKLLRGGISGNAQNRTSLNLRSKRALARRGEERVKGGQDSGTEGWQKDAHKNLPGFKLLYAKYPDADWYIMFDDDSYVFMDNLEYGLSKYNPKEPLYLGDAQMFAGCDGVTRIGDGPNFAQGGQGIIISQGGMQAMMKIVDQCIVKYHPCWAGDIRVGLCMRDAGILVTHFKGLHGIPPNSEFYFSEDPCDVPVLFHHSTPEQMQTFYNVERATRSQNSSRLTTMSSVFKEFFRQQALDRMENPPTQQYHRKTPEGLQKPLEENCKRLCFGNTGCIEWLYDWEETQCYLETRPCLLKPDEDASVGMIEG
ncbi:UNVERIFIED_CONTAM: hypothetical protein HDU68_012691, partial [Siphonaria sp. JEL0065]